MELGELTRSIGHKWSALWPKVRKLEENHGIGRALSAEEENRLLSAAARDDSPNRNPAMYPILCIALSTGMRSGEITSLRWSNIDLKTAMLTTGRAKTAAGTGRQIPINTDLAAILAEHAVWYREKIGEPEPDWYVFPGRTGRPKQGEQRPLDPGRPVGDITSAWDASSVAQAALNWRRTEPCCWMKSATCPSPRRPSVGCWKTGGCGGRRKERDSVGRAGGGVDQFAARQRDSQGGFGRTCFIA